MTNIIQTSKTKSSHRENKIISGVRNYNPKSNYTQNLVLTVWANLNDEVQSFNLSTSFSKNNRIANFSLKEIKFNKGRIEFFTSQREDIFTTEVKTINNGNLLNVGEARNYKLDSIQIRNSDEKKCIFICI